MFRALLDLEHLRYDEDSVYNSILWYLLSGALAVVVYGFRPPRIRDLRNGRVRGGVLRMSLMVDLSISFRKAAGMIQGHTGRKWAIVQATRVFSRRVRQEVLACFWP